MPWSVEERLAEVGARRWLVTGGAGFIGSHLVEALLRHGQHVTVIDNLATGYVRNVEDARARSGAGPERLTFLQEDITDLDSCRRAVAGIDWVLHMAALGSVPRSINDPLASHRANVDGFINLLVAARDAGVRRFVYASSSSVYGDHPRLPKVEGETGRVLSPYAATKAIGEVYAGAFQRTYGIETVGLRFFNVFGPRQDPRGAYAAVIPRWLAALAGGEPCVINGDGSTSRDFCFVANAVQACLRAALVSDVSATDRVYNVAVGQQTTLTELYELIRQRVARANPEAASPELQHRPFRAGDVKHSLADVALARERLGYSPTHTIAQGLDETVAYYLAQAAQ